MEGSLPDEVLIELGRLTWAAIDLESCIDTVCSFINYSNPRDDRRSIGRKIKDARADMRTWEQAAAVGPVHDWLSAANDAIESRNALLHAVPLTRFDAHHRVLGSSLGEMPRKGRDYKVRDMTVEHLREITDEISRASSGWMEALALADSHHPYQVAKKTAAESDGTT